ncbi:MAG: EAL domain-containing protein [Alteripontixanthobacter sp.]
MTKSEIITADKPAQLTAKRVLGLDRTDPDEWARLRSLQFARLQGVFGFRLVAQSIAVAFAAYFYFGQVPPLMLFGWVLLMALLLLYSASSDRKMGDFDKRQLTFREFTRHTSIAGVLGLGWAVPLALFASYGALADQLGVWILVATLIAGGTLVFAAAPLSTMIFAGITGAATAGSLVYLGHPVLAAAVLMFVAVVLPGCIATARAFLQSRIAEAGVAEKSEVVSLLLREFEENEADWLWQVDTARRVRSVSPRFAFALGKQPEETEGMPFLQLVSGDSWETGQFPASLHDLAERLKRRESFSNLLVKVTIEREHRWWELSGTPMLNDSGQYIGFRGVGSDVTEQRESSEKIAYLARYDTLTGLPNRLMLNEALGEAMRYAQQWRTRCAFLMLDLDRFKAVNDSLGHLVGDRLLAQVSNRLKSLMTDSEMCGRLGGDEFAVVIRDVSEKERIERVSRRIIERLSQPYEVDNHTLYVGASVGSAIGPRDGATVEELMRNADLALYRAKDEGGGGHCAYEPTLHQLAEERRQLEFSLRRALENKELELNFQPVVNANDESLVSFEALLRWNSGDHGFVSPGKFIPLAEDTRLIVPIGAWVLEQACREATNWPSHIRIAVNVSPEQLVEPGFTEVVVRALSASGLDAQRLEIEVTESIFLRDPTIARNALEQIMALGCSVALDDFGTGYSSLGYLRKLRFSTIKVDRSFVQGASQGSAESIAIIRAVVAMADSLGMSTTAEGVETAEEAEMILELGCKKIQGYYFGRPMQASDVGELFRRRDRRAS